MKDTENKMPDVIYATVENGNLFIDHEYVAPHYATDYHHDDIHQTTITERDALKALCEQMAKILAEAKRLGRNVPGHTESSLRHWVVLIGTDAGEALDTYENLYAKPNKSGLCGKADKE